MRSIVKAGLTAAGYVAAFAIALGVVAVQVATNGPDSQGSSGMNAFGDGLLFVAIFAVAAIPATCLALFFLRRYRPFWLVLSVVASAIALSGVGALLVYVVAHKTDAHSMLQDWSELAVLRVLGAPLFSPSFLLACIFAPSRVFRIALLIAGAIEGTVLCFGILMWIG